MIFYLLLFILIIIFVQDIRIRAVYWFLFPLVFVLSLWYRWQELTYDRFQWNGMFILFSLLFLTLYISLKQQQITAIWKGFFSWGDILFLLSIIPLFSFFPFLVYFTLGTVLTLVFHLMYILRTKQSQTIPYAGNMSLLLVVVLLFENTFNNLLIQFI